MNKSIPAASLACVCLIACGKQAPPPPAGSPPTPSTQGPASGPLPAAGPFPRPEAALAPASTGATAAAWTAPLVAGLDAAQTAALKDQTQQQEKIAGATADMNARMDALRALTSPPAHLPPPPDLAAKRQKIEADLAKAKAQFETAQAALNNHATPATFNAVQAQLRRALARDQLKEAERVLADFKNTIPVPSAEQWGALKSDLDVFSKRGKEPFAASLPAAVPPPGK